MRGIVCQYLKIKLKLHLLLFYPSTGYICDFFLLHIETEGKGGGIMGGGGGGGKGYVGPPSKIIGGAWHPLASPLPTPMEFVYLEIILKSKISRESKSFFYSKRNKKTRSRVGSHFKKVRQKRIMSELMNLAVYTLTLKVYLIKKINSKKPAFSSLKFEDTITCRKVAWSFWL